MSGDECTICEGGGGWWQFEANVPRWLLVDCEHCDRTGIEPDPGVMPTPGLYDWVRSLPPIEWPSA